MKYYDSMGCFESEHGIWVRRVDAAAKIDEAQMAAVNLSLKLGNAETRIKQLESENARLNMEMAAYRQGCTRADAEAMMAVKDALQAEKEARCGPRSDSRCPNMMHKRYAMLNCIECSLSSAGTDGREVKT